MRSVVVAIVVTALATAGTSSVTPGSFSPAAIGSRQAGQMDGEHLSVFPPGAKKFDIPLPLITRWFAYGQSGRSVYATTLKQTVPRSFTDQRGIFKIELEPMRVSAIPGLDAFYIIGRFAVSLSEDMVVFGGSKSYGPAGKCGIYQLNLPTGDVRAVIETSDCGAGSPWRVLSLNPKGTEALITADRGLALLDLLQGSMIKVEGQLSGGSFSPDGKWIATLQLGDPKAPSKTILIDRTDLTRRRDLGGVEDSEVVWSPDSRFLLHAVYRPACPSQNPLALETLDVQTGKRSLIKESVCNCGSTRTIGWVRSDLTR